MTDTLARPSNAPAVVALVLAVLGAAVMAWSFVSGVNAALDSSGSGATPYIVAFLAAAAAVLIALILGIVGLVRGRSRVLSAIAVVVALIPVAAVIILRIAAIS